MKGQARALAAAFTFLTRFPLARFIQVDAGDLQRSSLYFPIVGVFVGAAGAGAFAIAHWIWTPPLAVVISVMVTVWMTGAIHEDALADSLDGFGGGWTPEQTLAIMKDSRVGSYALVGVVLVLLAKIGALVAIHDHGGPDRVWRVSAALMAAHTVARCSSVWLLRALPYVRVALEGERPGTGRAFANGTSLLQPVGATLMTVVVAGAVCSVVALPVLAVAVAVTAIGGRYCRKRIGGITGDALGAANQMVELCVYLTLAARPLQS